MGQLLEICEKAALAGVAELRAWEARFQTREKAPSDLVTDADLASQVAIRNVIGHHFPDDLFVGEEQDAHRKPSDASRRTWIVDPLDGTANYVHGFPAYAVSIAVVQGDELLAGVIYDPTRDESFRAEAGQGAWLGSKRLSTSGVQAVGDALVAVSLPHRVSRDSPDVANLVSVVPHCQGLRRSGSAAINLAYVAASRLDAFWASQINPWDVAAGILLVREAGGTVSGIDGRDFELWDPHFLASAGADLHADLLRLLKR
jgi:myo-inositol-1(or 4)-monophosphatase